MKRQILMPFYIHQHRRHQNHLDRFRHRQRQLSIQQLKLYLLV
jgi:hypothetical protein